MTNVVVCRRCFIALALAGMGLVVGGFLPATPAQYNNQNNKAADVRVPLYGASYVGPDGTADDRLKRMEGKLDTLVTKLEFVETTLKKWEQEAVAAQTKQEQESEQDEVVRSVLTVCVKCHHPAVAEAKGQGYAMFDATGKYLKIPREMKKQVKRINSDNPEFVMPPPKAGVLTVKQKTVFSTVALAYANSPEHNVPGK